MNIYANLIPEEFQSLPNMENLLVLYSMVTNSHMF